MSKNNFYFKPKARLLLQLGDQLIRNETVAIFELVKNCYDANATYASVSFKDIDVPKSGNIIIEDDGDGMDLNIVKNVWMQPGTDYKEKIYKSHKDDTEFKKRLPIGEKGIGRFGAYKLGNTIELITKQENAKTEIYFKIDWSDLLNIDYLNDVNVEVFEREPQYFLNDKKGTRLKISNLRNVWSRKTLRETVRLINTLTTPRQVSSIDSFQVIIAENKEWTDGLLDVGEVIKLALFRAKFIIRDKEIIDFKYKFSPWDSMIEMNPRSYHGANISMREQVIEEGSRKKTFKNIDLSLSNIGEVQIFFYAYSFDTNIMKLEIDDRQGFKNYVTAQSGVKVYRDGMRVYDYGEKSNDWLGLDIRRVNKPGITISNNQLIGYVMLNRSQSSDLIEKSNREGFVENEAYETFEKAVSFALQQFEIQRNIDKSNLNAAYVSKTAKEPVVRRLSELKDTIESKVKDDAVRTDLHREIARIEDEYNEIVETFIKSANAGISLGVAIHEIDKVVDELNRSLDSRSEKALNHAQDLARRLTELVKGYSLLLRSKDTGLFDIKAIVKQALFNVDFRLRAHGIELITNVDQYSSTKLKCSRSISIGAVTNLIDNSIWWLGYKEIKNKKLYVGLSNEADNYDTVIVADNGIGYTIPPEDAIKPFIHGRPTGAGIGLGLFIANQCMENQGGELLFPDFQDFTIPGDFKKGAITALSFRRKTK